MACRLRPAPKYGKLESAMFVIDNENKEKQKNKEIKAQKQPMTAHNKTKNKQINTHNKAKKNTKDIKTKDVEAIIKQGKNNMYHHNSYMK